MPSASKILGDLVSTTGSLSVTNTSITGTITGSQISSNTLANTVFQTGSVENYMNAAGLGFGMRNRIINGAMVIDQRNAGALVSGAAGEIYGVDRFLTGVFGSGTGRISAQQSSTAPTGFVKSLINTVTTADASPSANYGYCVSHRIEGFNTSDLDWGTANAKTITISFWVRNSITGTYSISVSNDAITWGYTTTYTINSANTWEYKTITISGPTSGTWETTNIAGIRLVFGLGGGSNRQATLNSWYAPTSTNTPTDASGCVDWIATNGATFYITGVQLEKGSTATSFDYRSYGAELTLCQRYYFKDIPGNNFASMCMGSLYSSTTAQLIYPFKVTMRGQPTIAISGVTIQSSTTATNNISSVAGSYNGYNSSLIEITVSGFTARDACWMNSGSNGTTAYVEGSAEL